MASHRSGAANAAGMNDGLKLVLDLVLAAALGGAVGVQRQAAQKPAGFRTHLLVALASCAFAEVSRLAGDDRIAANVLTGIGFLGAGAIFRSGMAAHGLTTAASIWTVAAVGVAIGFGAPHSFEIALAVTVLTIVALIVSDDVFTRSFVHRSTVRVLAEGSSSNQIAAVFAAHHIPFSPSGDIRITNSAAGPVCEMHYRLGLPRAERLADVVLDLSRVPGVREVTSFAAPASSL